MKRKLIYNITRLGCFFTLMFLLACDNEVLLSGSPGFGNESDNKVKIEIFNRADSYNLPATRAANEWSVGGDPWVLVFRGGDDNATFVEAVQAVEAAGTGKRYVLLTKQNDGSSYQILILANPKQKYYYGSQEYDFANFPAGLPVGGKLSVICNNLRTEVFTPSAGNYMPYNNGETIPMSYLLKGLTGIDNTTKIANVDGTPLLMTRVIAYVLVFNEDSRFKFKGIATVANVPRQGQWHNLGTDIMNSGTNLTAYRKDDSYSSNLITATGENTNGNPVYLYETNTRETDTYMILQGEYEGKNYYYKMAMVDMYDQSNPKNLLRNNGYIFQIKQVLGAGYETIADAQLSNASNVNLKTELVVNDSDTHEIIANDSYYLGVSNSVFIAYTNSKVEYNIFDFITNCTVDFHNANTIKGNISSDLFRLSSPDDGIIPIVESTNPRKTSAKAFISGGLADQAYVTLKLGNLEKVVEVKQRSAIPSGGEVLGYIPSGDSYSGRTMNYYCLSASLDDAISTKNWIKLRPSSMVSRNDTTNITVDDGKIFIEVEPNSMGTTRSGTVNLTTISSNSPSGSSTQRIKIDITQLGN
nr:DUF4906 domain-containing protein [Parabacteroides goldsteinii]